jgi:hypothetical protein
VVDDRHVVGGQAANEVLRAPVKLGVSFELDEAHAREIRASALVVCSPQAPGDHG